MTTHPHCVAHSFLFRGAVLSASVAPLRAPSVLGFPNTDARARTEDGSRREGGRRSVSRLAPARTKRPRARLMSDQNTRTPHFFAHNKERCSRWTASGTTRSFLLALYAYDGRDILNCYVYWRGKVPSRVTSFIMNDNRQLRRDRAKGRVRESSTAIALNPHPKLPSSDRSRSAAASPLGTDLLFAAQRKLIIG